MNNTIAWIMTIFIIVTIIVDLSALMLMRTNKKTYEQNGNNPRKGKAYWTYLVVSRLAFAMTFVAGALIITFIGKGAVTLLPTLSPHALPYAGAVCICLIMSCATWYLTKSEIQEEQNNYNADDDDSLEPFIESKDKITVNRIFAWLVFNILFSITVITAVSILTHSTRV